MKSRYFRAISALAFPILLLVQAARADSTAKNEPPQTQPAAPSAPRIHWLDSLDAGYLQAQQTSHPIFVYVGSPEQATCRTQWDALVSPEVLHRMEKWTPVRLDPDKAADAIHSIGVASIPALRLLTPAGRVAASKEGLVAAADVAGWMDEQFPRLSGTAPLGVSSVSDTQGVERAVTDLASPDPVVREAAIRLLIPAPQAAERVSDVLARGSLSARLAAIDVLEQWHAPIGQIDPWETSTLTAQRVAALRDWAKSMASSARSTTQPDPSTRPLAIDPSELDELISATTDIESRAVRERLVRFGPALLPRIYARLAAASDDASRQRLSALRYRLVATESLAAQWPGGFDRLGSTDPAIRRAAAVEFAARARPEDHRLIVELFGDADPVVREQALRLLRSVGGEETSKSLMQLLADPEPNVRAAVLKTLAENPDPSVAPDLVRYVGSEQDADLLVHAVRVLQVTPGEPAFHGLLGLLGNPQWRVRGEAAEAMREKLDGRDRLNGEDRQTAIVALIKLLDDSDGYVVSRAVAALMRSELASASEPALKAVERHPELATDVLQAFTGDVNTAKTAMPRLLAMVKNSDPRVRAAVVPVICQLVPRASSQTLTTAFHDPDAGVRAAAARSMVQVMNAFFPADRMVTRSSFFGLRQTREQVDVSKWVEDFRSGKERMPWMDGFVPDLEKALSAGAGNSPVWAAVALCALGREKEALAVLNATATDGGRADVVGQALRWLPWELRLDLFTRLNSKVTGTRQRGRFLEEFIAVPDDRAAPILWKLLSSDSDVELLSPGSEALQQLYFGSRYSGGGNLTGEKLQAMVRQASEQGAHGSELQKTAALYLLLSASPKDVVPVARAISQDSKASPMLRLDATQSLLWSLPDNEAMQLAIQSVADKGLGAIAIPFLAVGREYQRRLHDELWVFSSRTESMILNSGDDNAAAEPIVKVTVPSGIPIKPLQDALTGGDPAMAGYAGYILVVMGDRRGYEPLLAMARTKSFSEEPWRKLVYRAISKMNDPAQIPVLEQVYKSFEKQPYYIKDFYWTIRSMTGPQALALRKTIRDEIGMDRLR